MNTRAKILEIIENFGIKDKKAAEFMNMSYPTFFNKKQERNYNTFKPGELYDLISKLREETDKLP